jgi:chromatin segregation and condensation protein Rec8/ScpA/Scc1 (kleisin family)
VTQKSNSKPFYMKPPWNILFDMQLVEKINPWNVNLNFLLVSFLEEMERRDEVDFRASGMALDSSTAIYLMKADLLLKLEEPPKTINLKSDFVPPPLILPLRYEVTTTTIQNLLDALDNALKTEKKLVTNLHSKKIPIPPPEILPSINLYLIEIEEQMNRLLLKIQIMKEDVIKFTLLVKGQEKMEVIQTFIILLFLAQTNKISLWQEKDNEDIFITIKEISV